MHTSIVRVSSSIAPGSLVSSQMVKSMSQSRLSVVTDLKIL